MLGFAGVAAIAFKAHTEGKIEFDVMLPGSLLGAFLLLYVAFFGALAWRTTGDRSGSTKGMSNAKWRIFWFASVAFLVIATSFLASRGVFKEANPVVLGMVGLSFIAVGAALYYFVKDRPDDFG